jgi:hypothetical protein
MNVLAGSTPEAYYEFVKENPKVMLAIFKDFGKDEESLEAARLMLILSERASGCSQAFSNREQTEVDFVFMKILRKIKEMKGHKKRIVRKLAGWSLNQWMNLEV